MIQGTPLATSFCPICLREITRAEVVSSGIEHIIPQVVVKQDPPEYVDLGTKNQRCGITALCRQQRTIASTGEIVKDGCNGYKGRVYDWAMRYLLDTRVHSRDELRHRHGVAILVMGYLGAFQLYGYEYILRPELDEVRQQFDYPDDRKTTWLNDARYHLQPFDVPLVATDTGHPFITGGVVSPNAPLSVLFRRCEVLLPSGYWQSSGVRTLDSLIPEP